MKIKDNFLRFALLFLVALSLVLSYLIWMSPITFTESKEENETEKVTAQINSKSATEIYLPSKVIWHKEEKLMSSRENLLNLLQSELIKGTFQTLNFVSDNPADYQKILQKTKGVELDYPSHFRLGDYLNIFDMEMSFKNTAYEDINFNKLFLDMDNDVLYVMEDATFKVYETSMKVNQKAINSLLSAKENTFLPVSIGHENFPTHYYVETDFYLPKYSYILGTQPYTTFTTAFFKDSQNLTINDNGSELLYFNNTGESLAIVNSTGKVIYNGKVTPTTDEERNFSVYRKSFPFISAIATQLGNLRYFTEDSGTLSFNTYVEGYPLFSEDGKGQVKIKFTGENAIEIATNVQSIQIPIPAEENVSVENTSQMLESLLSLGADKEKIFDFEIGYSWQKFSETTQAIDLTPTWFINYDNVWLAKDDLVKRLGGEN